MGLNMISSVEDSSPRFRVRVLVSVIGLAQGRMTWSSEDAPFAYRLEVGVLRRGAELAQLGVVR